MWTEGANEHPPVPLSGGGSMVKKEYEGEGRSYGALAGHGNGYAYGDGLGHGDGYGYGGGKGYGHGGGYRGGGGLGFDLDDDAREVIRLGSY